MYIEDLYMEWTIWIINKAKKHRHETYSFCQINFHVNDKLFGMPKCDDDWVNIIDKIIDKIQNRK